MPLLGKAVRHEWPLDWDFVTVNHGSFGAAPRVVLAAQRDWQQRLEAQPSRFMRTVLPGRPAPCGRSARCLHWRRRQRHRVRR